MAQPGQRRLNSAKKRREGCTALAVAAASVLPYDSTKLPMRQEACLLTWLTAGHTAACSCCAPADSAAASAYLHGYICVMSSWQEQARRPSYAQVLRQLKRRECGMYNCINSVLADAAFVREIAALYPGFPVLANLRCGLWYVPEPAGTCYFKSTDGHFGKWGVQPDAAQPAPRTPGCTRGRRACCGCHPTRQDFPGTACCVHGTACSWQCTHPSPGLPLRCHMAPQSCHADCA